MVTFTNGLSASHSSFFTKDFPSFAIDLCISIPDIFHHHQLGVTSLMIAVHDYLFASLLHAYRYLLPN